jgi:phosphoribosylformylglycinamidine cyclo-ligase
MTDGATYADAGVDIEKANTLVSAISRITKQTSRMGVISEIGGFAGLFSIQRLIADMQHPVLVSSTDGVGTKLKIAFMLDKHDTIGIDLVAMCVNDILVQGAKPLCSTTWPWASSTPRARKRSSPGSPKGANRPGAP